MVCEYTKGGELFEHITKKRVFEEHEVAEIILQIVHAVQYCHHNGIVHGDIKAENLMFDCKEDNLIKLIDFGTSQPYNRKT